MTKHLVLALPWQDIEQWHKDVSKSCDVALNECEQFLNPEEPVNSLIALLQGEKSCRFFQTPESRPWSLPTGEDDASEAERRRWGRRVTYYLQACLGGLTARHKIAPSQQSEHARLSLNDFVQQLSRQFPTSIASIDELKLALGHEPHLEVLVSFFISYIDPLLYSCLIYLNLLDQLQADHIPTYLQKGLLTRIQQELERCLSEEAIKPGRQPLYTDEASVWWAIRELLERLGAEFSVGTDAGYEGAARICRRLIGNESRDLVTPYTLSRRWLDTTPEIYTPFRTRLFVLLNSVLFSQAMPVDTDDTLGTLLERVAIDHFRKIQNVTSPSWDVYQLGIALEVSSRLLTYRNSVSSFASPDLSPANGPGLSEPQNHSTASGAFLLPGIELPGKKVIGNRLYVNGLQHSFGGPRSRVLRALAKNKTINRSELSELSGVEKVSMYVKRILESVPALKNYLRQKPGTDGKTIVYESEIQDFSDLLACAKCKQLLPLVAQVKSQTWFCSKCGSQVKGKHQKEALAFPEVCDVVALDGKPL